MSAVKRLAIAALLGAVMGASLTGIFMSFLQQADDRNWRCTAYLPGSTACAVYTRVGYRGKDDDGE